MLRRFIKNFNTLQNGLAYLLYAHLLFFSANTQTNKVKSTTTNVVQWRKKKCAQLFYFNFETFYFISDVCACFDDACFLDTTLFQIIIKKNKKIWFNIYF